MNEASLRLLDTNTYLNGISPPAFWEEELQDKGGGEWCYLLWRAYGGSGIWKRAGWEVDHVINNYASSAWESKTDQSGRPAWVDLCVESKYDPQVIW